MEQSGQHGWGEKVRGDGSHVPLRLRAGLLAGASAAAFLAQTACTVVPSLLRLLSETGQSDWFAYGLKSENL